MSIFSRGVREVKGESCGSSDRDDCQLVCRSGLGWDHSMNSHCFAFRRIPSLAYSLAFPMFQAAAAAKQSDPLDGDVHWRRAKEFVTEFTSERLGYFDEKGAWTNPHMFWSDSVNRG